MAMTTPTPITTFEDILAAMENDPRLRAAMRQHVLDQEFLQLPAIVRELQQTVAELAQLVRDYIASTNERLDRLESGQARLEGSVGRLEGDVAELKTGQARLDGNMNRLIGSDYERKAARRASRLVKRYLGIDAMQVIYAVTMPDDNRLPQILDRALSAGQMDASEADELEEVDIVLRGPGEYAVAEVSVTLDENDVQRAHQRAELLAKAITEPVRAVVIGARALDSAVQPAAANNVAIMILPE